MVNNVVYVQDLGCDAFAVSLSNGSLLWEYTSNRLERNGPDPIGVAVANGVVYGLSPTTAFAPKAANVHMLWVNRTLLK